METATDSLFSRAVSLLIIFLSMGLLSGCDGAASPSVPLQPGQGTALSGSPAPTGITEASPPGLGSIKISPIDGMKMVFVPAGPFPMGSTTGLTDEQPVHTVTLDSFWLDQTEITNAQYRLCVNAGGCRPPPRRIISIIRPMHSIPSSSYPGPRPRITADGRGDVCPPRRSGRRPQPGIR